MKSVDSFINFSWKHNNKLPITVPGKTYLEYCLLNVCFESAFLKRSAAPLSGSPVVGVIFKAFRRGWYIGIFSDKEGTVTPPSHGPQSLVSLNLGSPREDEAGIWLDFLVCTSLLLTACIALATVWDEAGWCELRSFTHCILCVYSVYIHVP